LREIISVRPENIVKNIYELRWQNTEGSIVNPYNNTPNIKTQCKFFE